MRPRVFPAEDTHIRRLRHSKRRGFNEAAGIPRGRPSGATAATLPQLGFNEAAGIPRGRLSIHMKVLIGNDFLLQ